MPEKYNGYYNYNVWNVMLYIDNEHSNHLLKMDAFDKRYEGKMTAAQFKKVMARVGRTAHMQSDIKREKLTKKEIAELHKELNEQYKEHKEYRDEKKG